ncbi:hypothetical protein C1Y40_01182 [Mycobacterium talmoniae]|uniref:Uncharacterized protein n=1 Tax=Mycobacterium talmoniae TaxID=1858794 RepID=A0A2S8BPQ1_9MYCO|nr:hypothetical protein C1Y40_01182 [Mycobacterium talmoniae]
MLLGRRVTSSSAASGPYWRSSRLPDPYSSSTLRPAGMVVSPIITSRVVVRHRPCTGEVSRSSSSTASRIRPGSSISSRRWSGRWCSNCTEPPSIPVVVSLPPVTMVKVNARIDNSPAMSPSAPSPAATRCDTVSSAGSARRRSIRPVK